MMIIHPKLLAGAPPKIRDDEHDDQPAHLQQSHMAMTMRTRRAANAAVVETMKAHSAATSPIAMIIRPKLLAGDPPKSVMTNTMTTMQHQGNEDGDEGHARTTEK